MQRPLSYCACGVLAALLDSTVRAEDYSWELAAGASEMSADGFAERDRASLSATRYFGSVDDARGPYALAAFFDPESRITFAVERAEQRNATVPFSTPAVAPLPTATATATDDSYEYSIGGRHVLPQSRWYFGGRYARIDEDTGMAHDIGADAKSYGVHAGKYFGANTTLALGLDRSTTRTSAPFVVCVAGELCFVAGRLSAEIETDAADLEILHVRSAQALTYTLFGRVADTHATAAVHQPAFTLPVFSTRVFGVAEDFALAGPTIAARTTRVDLDDSQSYTVGGELFPTAKLGVRIAYSRWNHSVADDAYDVAATWFFKRNVGVQLGLARQRVDGSAVDRDADVTTLRLIGRL